MTSSFHKIPFSGLCHSLLILQLQNCCDYYHSQPLRSLVSILLYIFFYFFYFQNKRMHNDLMLKHEGENETNKRIKCNKHSFTQQNEFWFGNECWAFYLICNEADWRQAAERKRTRERVKKLIIFACSLNLNSLALVSPDNYSNIVDKMSA